MATVEIPLDTTSKQFSIQVLLDGTVFDLLFLYNDRESVWYISLRDVSKNEIVSGEKLVTNWPLFVRSVDLRKPLGQLLLYDPTRRIAEVTLDMLGSVAKLLYIPQADLL